MAEDPKVIYKYRVWCTTDNKFVEVWSDTEPTVCPENNAHGVDTGKTAIVDNVTENDVVLRNANTDAGVPRVAIEKSDKGGVTQYSQDFCNKRTWFQGSTRVVGEVASGVANVDYHVEQKPMIDSFHGLIMDEDNLVDSNGDSYRAVVRVDDVEKTENSPDTTDGDYDIDYENGTVTFNTALSGSPVVEVDYCYAGSSVFSIAPMSTEVYHIEMVEIQFSADVVMNDSVVFAAYGLSQYFIPERTNPELIDPNSTLYDPANYVPAGMSIPIHIKKYKTVRNLLDDAVKAYAKYPAISSSNWRGTNQETIVMDWDYVRSIPLDGSKGMEMRLYLESDTEFGGEFATATFYCSKEDL